MYIGHKDPERYLYHYTKAETAIDFILKDKTIKLSNYTNTNDPKESKNWFFVPITYQGRNLKKYTPENLSKIINPILKNRTNLICFSKDKQLTGNHVNDMNNRGFCKPRMWAQYGDNHKGVCLIFDMNIFSSVFHEQFNRKASAQGRVQYRDQTIAEQANDPAFMVNIDQLEELGVSSYLYNHVRSHKSRLFFEKATDWSNEDEFRFIIFNSENDVIMDYRDSLHGIVFGENCTEEHIRTIVNLTMGRGLFKQKLSWKNAAPWFEFDRVL